MSNNTTASIESLPVETFYRIFDNLDAETILLSIRPVCRLFRALVNTYNRYILNFKLMAKPNFLVLCRLINPENIISLTLSNNRRTSNQIALFISLVSLPKLTRLRSLTFVNISQSELDTIMKHTDLTNLTSFSFDTERDYIARLAADVNLISLLTEKPNRPKLEFDLDNKELSNISGPMNRTIQRLMINDNVKIDKIHGILQCCSHLHTLIVKSFYGRIPDGMISKSFHQLKSLTIEAFQETIDVLESFLLLTPSLVYLKVFAERMLNGKRWEEFIRIHLPYLDKFEFYFKESTTGDKTHADIELIIAPYRTSFWLDHKKWFVMCEYNGHRSIHLYSIPIIKSDVTYNILLKEISLSTQPMAVKNDATMNNNIKSLGLFLHHTLADDIKNTFTNTTATYPLFSKVTEIDFNVYEAEHPCSMKLLSMLIDFPQIVQLTLKALWFKLDSDKSREEVLLYLKTFLKQTCNLSSLVITGDPYPSSTITDYLCSIVPRHLRHLQMLLNNVRQIKTIIERCENLSTIEFKIEHGSYSDVVKWFDDNTIYSTCSNEYIYKTIYVWLGKKKSQSSKVIHDNKRFKSNDMYSNS